MGTPYYGGGGSYSRRRRDKWSITDTRTRSNYPKPEVKFVDKQIGTVLVPLEVSEDGTFIHPLNELAQGVSGSQRIGQQVGIKSCYYQYVVNFGTSAQPIVVRSLLVWDRTPNGGTPTMTDVLSTTTATFITAPMNLANRDRFVILSDERITLSPQGEQIKIVDSFRKINQVSTYNDVGLKPQTGGLFLMMVSDEDTEGVNPTVYGDWRVRYVDN